MQWDWWRARAGHRRARLELPARPARTAPQLQAHQQQQHKLVGVQITQDDLEGALPVLCGSPRPPTTVAGWHLLSRPNSTDSSPPERWLLRSGKNIQLTSPMELLKCSDRTACEPGPHPNRYVLLLCPVPTVITTDGPMCSTSDPNTVALTSASTRRCWWCCRAMEQAVIKMAGVRPSASACFADGFA